MLTKTHPNYQRLVDAARRSHEAGRVVADISEEEITLARLYCYAFRVQTIGLFHGVRLSLEAFKPTERFAAAHHAQALMSVEDLIHLAMDVVPSNFRALISTFHQYDRKSQALIDALTQEHASSGDAAIQPLLHQTIEGLESVTTSNGIYLTRDKNIKDIAGFIVPGLGITIIPLVYGDHHSWNIANLEAAGGAVPRHVHDCGVEIHLGFSPMRGYMVLDDHASLAEESYALPIPPKHAHGYINASDLEHHVPFIFGSIKHSGWGVFFDVNSRECTLDDLQEVRRNDSRMNQAVHLEREIAQAEQAVTSRRWPIIHAERTFQEESGGLELSISRVATSGLEYPVDLFRAVSVVRGEGVIEMAGLEQTISPHDHFGIPAGVRCVMRQQGETPLVVLDTVIRDRIDNIPAALHGAKRL